MLQHLPFSIFRKNIIILLALFALLAGLLATMAVAPAEAMGPCTNGPGSMLAFGLPHHPQGNAELAFQNGTLTINNIGDSGQDGVGINIPAGSRGVQHEFSYDDLGNLTWAVQGKTEFGDPIVSKSTFEREAEISSLIFTDGFESGDVSVAVYLDDIIVGTTMVPDEGVIAKFHDIGNGTDLHGSELSWIGGMIEGADVEWIYFLPVVDMEIGGDIFTGNRLVLNPLGMAGQGYTATCDLWRFRAPNGGTIAVDFDLTAQNLFSQWHHVTSENTIMEMDDPAGPLDVTVVFTDPAVLNTYTGDCPACTLTYDFAAPLFLPTNQDALSIKSIDKSTPILNVLSELQIKRMAEKPAVCPSLPGHETEFDLTFLREDDILAVFTVANGECLTLPWQIAITQASTKSLCNNEVLPETSMFFKRQGSNITLEVRATPHSCPVDTWQVNHSQISYTRSFSLE